MIKDYAIRSFIFKHYIKNVKKDLRDLSGIIYSILQDIFLRREEVIYNNKEGLLIKISKDKYYVLIKKDFRIIQCLHNEIVRKYRLDRNDIFDTLEFITYETPLGVRLLKKNIYSYVTNKSSIREYLTHLNKNSRLRDSEFSTETEMLSGEEEKDDLYFNDEYSLVKDKNQLLSNMDFVNVLNSQDSINRNLSNGSSDKIINQDTEIKNIKRSSKGWDITLDIPMSEVYEIPDLDFKYVNKIVRIYSFIYNFCPNKILLNVNIHKLVKSFREYSYISDVIGAIHGFLIENLLEERKSIGINNLLTNVKSVIDSISDNYINEDILIGNEVGMRGWKLKSRMLLLEMYKSTNNKKILSYYNVLNKKSPFDAEDTVRLRIAVVEFFINCYMATNIFRDIILSEIKKVRILESKAIELDKHYKSQQAEETDVVLLEEIKNKLVGLKQKIVLSPAKADIGQINGAKFFLVNNEVFMSKNNIFYVPSKNTIKVILEKCIVTDKAEDNTVNNLKNILESLYLNKL